MPCGSCVRELPVYREGQLEATFRPGQGTRIAGLQVPEITVDVDALFAAAGPPCWTRAGDANR